MFKGLRLLRCTGGVLGRFQMFHTRCRAMLYVVQHMWRSPARLLAPTLRAVAGGRGLVGAGLCALPVASIPSQSSSNLPEVDPSSLTTATLIRNAAAVAVESTSALLTQTFVAIVDKYKQLAQDIETLMDLLQQQLQAEKAGYLTEELSQAVIAARVSIDDRRHEIQELEAILNSALMSLEAASEAAFQAGREELAMMGRDRCHYANTQLAMTRAVIQKAERALARLQADSVRETPAAESGNETQNS